MAASIELPLDHSYARFLKLLPSLGITETDSDAIRQGLTIAWIVTVRAFITSSSLYVGDDTVFGVSYVGEGRTAEILVGHIHIDLDASAAGLREQIAQTTALKHLPSDMKQDALNATVTFNNQTLIKTGLYLNIIVESDRLLANLTFSTIEQALAKSVLHSFNQALTSLIEAPSLPIGDLDLCSQHDIQLLKKFTSHIQPPGNELLHDICLKHAKTHPNDLAIVSYDGNLTYGELEDLTSRLAHYLVLQGVQPETYVACSFQKSAWAIVARLAILRAGGAYVCIDSKDPSSYLDSIMDRANIRLLLSCSDHVAELQNLSVDRIIEITPLFVNSLPSISGTPCKTVKPCNVAILVFTSGSTGNPKGVVQEHRAYTSGALACAQHYGIKRGARQFQSAAMTFTVGDEDYFIPLVVGACCSVPRPGGDLRKWVEDINRTQTTHCFFTPTAALEISPESVPSLQSIQVGGEPMSESVMAKWSGHVKLVNKYGMSEVAVYGAMNTCVRPGHGRVVGRTAVGAHWVANPRSPTQLMPVGAVGELIHEGHNIARGYLDTPTNNLLSSRPQWLGDMNHRDTKLFRSGDLGRINHDGQLEVFGRKDTVLKLEGTRIEPQEVEHFLRICLGPRDIVIVDVLGGVNSGKENSEAALTAYINLTISQAPLTDVITFETITESHPLYSLVQAMKQTVEKALPRDLCPTLYVLVNLIPRTKSNKIHRIKLHIAGEQWYASR